MKEEKGQKNAKQNDENGSLLPLRADEDDQDPFLIEGKGDSNLSPDAGRPLI